MSEQKEGTGGVYRFVEMKKTTEGAISVEHWDPHEDCVVDTKKSLSF